MEKIAFIINYITRGGPSNVIRNIMRNLKKDRFDITLITLFLGNDDIVIGELKSEGIKVIECNSLTRMGCIFGQSKEFDVFIDRVKPDIIHSHGFIPDILSSCLHTKAKRVTTIHNNMFEDYLESYGRIKSMMYIFMHLRALRKLDSCVCCSESSYIAMKPHLLKITYIRNGIGDTNAKSVVKREDLAIPNNARLFVFAGQLNTIKNIVWLINSFVKYHTENEYLIVLGKGEMEKQCKEVTDDHVRMLGFQDDPIAYFRLSDIYISASKSEGFSISVLEALDNGLGLLLSDIPSHREILQMCKNIYLGELFTIRTFKEALARIRKSYIDKKNIVMFKESELSDKHMTDEYKKIYKLN